jgi:hypothetical protein
MTKTLDITQMLRDRTDCLPTSGEYEYDGDLGGEYTDFEPIDTLTLTSKMKRKVSSKAELARHHEMEEIKTEYPTIDSQFLERLGDVAHVNETKYWAVIYSLAIGTERAVDMNGIDKVRALVDNELSNYADLYDDFAVSCCEESGIKLKSLTDDEDVQIEEESPLLQVNG